jgi:hypothetical protein
MPYKDALRARQQKRDWKVNMTPEQKEQARKAERNRWAEKSSENKKHKFASRSPEQRRNYWLKAKYGITIEEWDLMFLVQGSRCANRLCGAIYSNTMKGWHLDHCHLTGKIRGILCSNCNIALGHAQENEQRLMG